MKKKELNNIKKDIEFILVSNKDINKHPDNIQDVYLYSVLKSSYNDLNNIIDEIKNKK
jgi:hypothetical protein